MRVKTHKELKVYQMAFDSSMNIFKISRSFPKEERYSLTDQMRRSSRSVSANIAEGFRKRRYPKSFISKLSDSEAEAAETQVWLDYCLECEYIDVTKHQELYQLYDHILGMLVNMIHNAEDWKI